VENVIYARLMDVIGALGAFTTALLILRMVAGRPVLGRTTNVAAAAIGLGAYVAFLLSAGSSELNGGGIAAAIWDQWVGLAANALPVLAGALGWSALASRRRWFFLAVGVGLALLPWGAMLVRARDFVFDVTGTISAEDGSALQDVEVVLRVNPPVYEGTTPVNAQRVVTSKGAFIFRCLSHSPSTKYSVTVRKDGFLPQTVSGTAPPNGHLTFRLKRVDGDGRGPERNWSRTRP